MGINHWNDVKDVFPIYFLHDIFEQFIIHLKL